jgi:hypothetical protein
MMSEEDGLLLDVTRSEETTRDRSRIKFAYTSMKDAIDIAHSVYQKAGNRVCEQSLLAEALGLTTTNSTFRVKLSTARIFGVIEVRRSQGTVKLTALGADLNDTQREQVARVEAFLHVPLYRRVYELYKDKQLASPEALNAELAGLGVPSRQADRARQIMMRSAEQAGLLSSDKRRLVRPAFDASNMNKQGEAKRGSGSTNESSATQTENTIDPLLAALIKKLPASGSHWAVPERVMWLKMAAMAFQMVYTGEDDMFSIKVCKTPE